MPAHETFSRWIDDTIRLREQRKQTERHRRLRTFNAFIDELVPLYETHRDEFYKTRIAGFVEKHPYLNNVGILDVIGKACHETYHSKLLEHAWACTPEGPYATGPLYRVAAGYSRPRTIPNRHCPRPLRNRNGARLPQVEQRRFRRQANRPADSRERLADRHRKQNPFGSGDDQAAYPVGQLPPVCRKDDAGRLRPDALYLVEPPRQQRLLRRLLALCRLSVRVQFPDRRTDRPDYRELFGDAFPAPVSRLGNSRFAAGPGCFPP